MLLERLSVALARYTDHESKVAAATSLNAGDGVLDHNRPRRRNAEQLCRHQERIRRRFSGEVLCFDHVAIDPHIEEPFQLGGLQDGRAVLARVDEGDFEAVATQLVDKSNASLVSLHPDAFNGITDQFVLAVAEPAHRFGLWGVVRGSLRQFDAARCEKVANAVETRLSIEMESAVRGKIEGTKGFASLGRAFLEVFVEHLFPTGGVQLGGVANHTIEVKKDCVVPVATDCVLVVRLPHRSLSRYQRPLPSTNIRHCRLPSNGCLRM